MRRDAATTSSSFTSPRSGGGVFTRAMAYRGRVRDLVARCEGGVVRGSYLVVYYVHETISTHLCHRNYHNRRMAARTGVPICGVVDQWIAVRCGNRADHRTGCELSRATQAEVISLHRPGVQYAILQPSPNLFRAKWLSRAGSAPTPARASPRSPHQKNPLPYFLRFPPAEFLF